MIELIPAIDIIDGKCVRLTQGDYARKTSYPATPLDVARAFEDHGFKRLHVVDLDGAASSHLVNSHVLEEITTRTSLQVDFGGGVKGNDDVKRVLDCGASFVTVGSVAVKDPGLLISWIRQYGGQRFILCADIFNGMVYTNGWKEESETSLDKLLEYYIPHGIRQVLCTDIARDGTLLGPAIHLYKRLIRTYPRLGLIASGGIASVQDFKVLDEAGVPAAVFGKAFYEGRITWADLEPFTNP